MADMGSKIEVVDENLMTFRSRILQLESVIDSLIETEKKCLVDEEKE
jgi:hypothetical protein